jgi:hypothetical protein
MLTQEGPRVAMRGDDEDEDEGDEVTSAFREVAGRPTFRHAWFDDHRVSKSQLLDARANGATKSFMKVLTHPYSDLIFGFTMPDTNAGDVMLCKLPCTAVRDAMIAHPPISEGLKFLFLKVPASAGGQ